MDVWSCPQEFQLDENLVPTECRLPPDGFSATGQLWGNPLFDWDAMAAKAMPGGCAASATCAEFMMCCALTISAALRGITPSPMVIRPPKTAAGALGRAMPLCYRQKRAGQPPHYC